MESNWVSTVLLALIFGSVVLTSINATAETVLTVGAQGQYQTISDAVNAANNDRDGTHYYVITVAPGTYTNDFPHVKRPLTIMVDPKYVGQEVLLKATEDISNRKGIIVAEGDLIVDGLSFEGAKIPNYLGGNGAGIRYENNNRLANLIVLNSRFWKNQTGILTSQNASAIIFIADTEFKNNGNMSIVEGPLCCQHAIYISRADSLTMINSIFCGQLVGHDIKSRALVNSIYRNTFYHGVSESSIGCNAGSASFAIDLPNGGAANITGNRIIQGPATGNPSIIAYGEEGPVHDNIMYLNNNEFIGNKMQDATLIFNPRCLPVQLVNNILSGINTTVSPVDCTNK